MSLSPQFSVPQELGCFMGKETRTEDDLLRGREHVQRKGDLVLVPFALEELDE